MKWRLLVLLVAACQRPPTFLNEPFACASSGECADGYACVMGKCATAGVGGGEAGGSSSGGSAGGVAGGAAGGSSGGAAGGRAGGAAGGTAGGSAGGTAGGMAGGRAGGSAGGGTDGGTSLGGTCVSSTTCASGLSCADGVCCENACGAVCDSCNQTGLLGRCRVTPRGVGCNAYLCDGVSTTCPTSCGADAGCAQGNTCTTANTCVRCWSGFTDSFTGGAAQWTLVGATVSAANELSLSVNARTNMSDTATATSTGALPLRGCGVSVRLATKPDVGNLFTGHLGFFPSTGSTPSFRWEMDARGLVAEWNLSDGGTGSTVVSGPSATWPEWLRIEERNGVVSFRTAVTTSFTTVATVPHAEPIDALVLRANASLPAQPGNVRTTLAIDDVNLGP